MAGGADICRSHYQRCTSSPESKMISSVSPVTAIIPPSYFAGILSERNYIALTLILIEQFFSVFAPVVTRFLAFVQVLLYPGTDRNTSSEEYRRYNFDSDASDGDRKKGAPIVSKSYARFIDDKKTTAGTKSDIQKLEDFGYDKYRYLSKSFMKRNNIVRGED